ncbi:MAG: cytochrome c biogenesis protein CcdA [Paenibacillaceae bacterium]|nr:cytochrome c biogenesis protein CcdA [Paenibacillaceae bacterium]
MEVTLGIAFVAGVVSFASPCCLPLYPSYLAYLSGVQSIAQRNARAIVFAHAVCFVIGFSSIYVVLGASAGVFAQFFVRYQTAISGIAGVLLVVMGLIVLGILRIPIAPLRWGTRLGRVSYVGSVLFGLGFAAGWTPCIGPSLAAIVALAARAPDEWFALTAAYALGFGLPFLILALCIGQTSRWARWGARISRIGGVLLIVFGVLLVTGQMARVSAWLLRWTPMGWLM